MKTFPMFRKIVWVILPALFLVAFSNVLLAQNQGQDHILKDKITGLLIGSFIGDALGGPIEFQSHSDIQALPSPPKRWKKGEVLDAEGLQQACSRMVLRSYSDLRPVPEPYGHWSYNAPPGTVTDDSRHKLILIHALQKAYEADNWPIEYKDLAQSYLEWPNTDLLKKHPEYEKLTGDWLGETWKAVNWLVGERDPEKSYPVERLWNGLPTCYGQMVLPPVAALYPGNPLGSYKAAYGLAFFDNSWGKDMNAALVAGLSVALDLDPNTLSNREIWMKIYSAMRKTDPYRYSEIPWTGRSVNIYLDKAIQFARVANGSPTELFEKLDKEFENTIKWEAQVPFAVIFSAIEICKYDPLAAMQLTIEWGYDHDSYAQLLGAFIGAIYGYQIFPEEMRQQVQKQLYSDYLADIDEMSELLWKLSELSKKRVIINYN